MVGTVGAERAARALEFGIYRDGDNNLDACRRGHRAGAERSPRDHAIEFTVEDTTARRGFLPAHVLRTETMGSRTARRPAHVSDRTTWRTATTSPRSSPDARRGRALNARNVARPRRSRRR